MTDSTHTTFADVLRLRDAVERSTTDAECDRLSDAKADAIDAVIDHGSTFDRPCVLALLAAEYHDVQHIAADLMAGLT
jgi:hypothetical protein